MSAPKKKEAPFQPSGETHRIISLGQGTWAYIFDQNGRKHHVKRTSPLMVKVCKEVDEAMNGRIRAELKELGWDDVLRKMDAE
jgi:hypothetical protein